MQKRPESSLWVLRVARGHRRLFAAMALSAATFLIFRLWFGEAWTLAWLLVGWDIGVLFYLITTGAMMAQSAADDIQRHCSDQDEGAFAVLVVTLTAAVASLAAIFVELGLLQSDTPRPGLHGALAVATVVLSWTLIHTILALHYAYEYYGDDEATGGLQFPSDGKPDYWDFVYFSFVIGMTFQVSDVAVARKSLRRMVVAHGVLSFFFTAAIISLTVNIASNIIQR